MALGLAAGVARRARGSPRARAARPCAKRHAGDQHRRAVGGAHGLQRGGADLLVGLVGAAEPRERLRAAQARVAALDRRVAGERAAEQRLRALVVARLQREQPAVVVGHRRQPRRREPRGELRLAIGARARLGVAAEPRERAGPQAGDLELDDRQPGDERGAAVGVGERALVIAGDGGDAGGVGPAAVGEVGAAGPLAGLTGGDELALGLVEPALGERDEAAQVLDVVAAHRVGRRDRRPAPRPRRACGRRRRRRSSPPRPTRGSAAARRGCRGRRPAAARPRRAACSALVGSQRLLWNHCAARRCERRGVRERELELGERGVAVAEQRERRGQLQPRVAGAGSSATASRR